MPGMILFGTTGYFLNKYIIKYEVYLYILAAIISVISLMMGEDDFASPELIVGFFLVVMFAGALPVRWTLTKRWMTLRRPYAIIGFILILSHGLSYVFDELDWFGLGALIIMTPLAITSFKTIRRKMTPKNWKLLHKLSYVAYVLIILHVGLEEEAIFFVIFFVYLIFKGYKEMTKRKPKIQHA